MGESTHTRLQESAATGQYLYNLNKGNKWLNEDDANRSMGLSKNKYEIAQTIKG
jgi:hypothetical protein